MRLNAETLSEFDHALRYEWLETNGLGGFASSTLSGAHSRKYHGLLVAAVHPPVQRMVVLSKLDETIVTKNERFELGCNQYPGVIHPPGYRYIKTFEQDLFPEFYYEAGTVTIKKTIAAIHHTNTTVVVYEVLEASMSFTLELKPFYACRDFHFLAHSNAHMGHRYLFQQGIFQTLNYQGCPELFIAAPQTTFTENKDWYYHFEYQAEKERGLDFMEDLYSHGHFSITLHKGDKLGIIVSVDDPSGKDAFSLLAHERQRREDLRRNFTSHKALSRLVLSADKFITKRDTLNSIIAGYHWFEDWGRDAMIALPGLCLATGRYTEAQKTLQAFAAHVSDGMIPNRFHDSGEPPEYNTIDATLWFVHALFKYYKHTHDDAFIKSHMPILKDIIRWHYKGTRYGIHVDPDDGLLSGGEEGTQLTWMDAKVGDWIVTPRHGKTVEVNALWYNTLCIMAFFAKHFKRKEDADFYHQQAQKVYATFNNVFWNDDQGCLYDYINGHVKNDDLRPNQLYAISLPFPLLSPARAAKVMEAVNRHLFTPVGLRSLAPFHKDYKPVCTGGVWQRDAAYHQGTVWSFLIGVYIDALIFVDKESGKATATDILNNFFQHLDEAGIGSISEIFDGNAPHTPRGCIAQAWSTAELLRVAVQYELFGLASSPHGERQTTETNAADEHRFK